VSELDEDTSGSNFEFAIIERVFEVDELCREALTLILDRLGPKGSLLVSLANASYIGVVMSGGRERFGGAIPQLVRELRLQLDDAMHILQVPGYTTSIVGIVQTPVQQWSPSVIEFAELTWAEAKLLSSLRLGAAERLIFQVARSEELDQPSAAVIPPTILPCLRTSVRILSPGNSRRDKLQMSHEEAILPMDGDRHRFSLELPPDPNTPLQIGYSDVPGMFELWSVELLNEMGTVHQRWSPLVSSIGISKDDLTTVTYPNAPNQPIHLSKEGLGDSWIGFSFAAEARAKSTRLRIEIAWTPVGSDREVAPYSMQDAQEVVSLLNQEVRQLRLESEKLRCQVEAQSQELREIRLSNSWRLTSPLRRATSLARRLVNSTSHHTQAAVWAKPGLTYLARMQKLFVSKGGVPDESDSVSDTPYDTAYNRWLERVGELSPEDRELMVATLSTWRNPPTFTVVVPVYRPAEKLLREMIESVRSQVYPYWELVLCDDFSDLDSISSVLEEYGIDERVHIIRRKTNGGIVAATNDAIAEATGEFIAFLDHDDLLAPEALYLFAFEIVKNRRVVLIYSDEDKIDENGLRYGPYFKGDYNEYLLLGQNFVSHFSAVRADIVRQVNGLRHDREGSQDWDLVLRVSELIDREQICHVAWVLYHWRSSASSTARSISAKPWAVAAGESAVRDAINRRGLDATAERNAESGHIQLRFNERDLGRVSIIIPTRDNVDLLRSCIDSLATTSYGNYEVIVIDNQSCEPPTLDYLEAISKKGVRVLSYDRPFNYAAMHNWVAPQCNGEFLCLLNNDVEVITPEWLSQMVSLASNPEIGIVGAQLLYPDGRVQHGGVRLGMGGIADHAHRDVPSGEGGYFGRLRLIQEYSAVTGACLLIKRSVWDEVGGMDERFRVAFNDIDLCLKVRQAGYLILYSPLSVLFHHESRTRGSDLALSRRREFASENALFEWKWPEALRRDPYVSPRLSRQSSVEIVEDRCFRKPWLGFPRRIRSAGGFMSVANEYTTIRGGDVVTSPMYYGRAGRARLVAVAVKLPYQVGSESLLTCKIERSVNPSQWTQLIPGARPDGIGFEEIWLFASSELELSQETEWTLTLSVSGSVPSLDVSTRISGDWGVMGPKWNTRSINADFIVEGL
jgi:glycosyltransferase involved in cell wall biosynthesis